MSAKKKKQEGGAAPEKAAAPVALPTPPVEAVKDPKIALISAAEYKRTLQTAKNPASLALVELMKQFCEAPPARGEAGKAAWLVPNASQGSQTIGEIKLTVEGKARTFSVHADTHIWAMHDLVVGLEKGEVLTLVSKAKDDESSVMKLGTMKSGKAEVVKNLQFYAK